MIFLVGTGPISESSMNAASSGLSRCWGLRLSSITSEREPNEVLQGFGNKTQLVQLKGDAAMASFSGSSWLDALASWRCSVVLMAMPLKSGQIPGIVSGYVALCRELSVPLVGILQLGGKWESKQRLLDGLPWCGIIPSSLLDTYSNEVQLNHHIEMELEDIVSMLKVRYEELNI